MKRPDPKKLQATVDAWNAKHPVGSAVVRYKLVEPRREPDPQPTVTRSQAWVLSGHSAVVLVESASGCVLLDSLEPLPTE